MQKDLSMSSVSSMASSSTSSPSRSFKYDVFISFSGEDTRTTFIDHLYAALQQQGIHTFKDDERLQKGKRINDELLASIQASRFYIIVFSKNYASSSWCLNELVQIMECWKTNEQIAYPVFYDVDPSEVRKQSGVVGEAFDKHTSNKIFGKSLTIHNKKTVIGKALAKTTKKRIWKWREAMKEAANLSGWDLRKTANGHESKVIKIIVERISLELRSINVEIDESLIGMEHRLQDLESSLDISLNDVRMIGIKGMGGAGKTTLARAIFDTLSIKFEAKIFVENVREVSKASLDGLLSLQRKVLSELLNDQINYISSVHAGKNMMKKKLGGKILLVLDDVDHIDQLEALAGESNWFEPGSRIIITTREEQVLIAHRVKWIHDVSLLTDVEAIQLFHRHAFGRDISNKEYEMLSLKVVNYAAGLPLTLKVLGSFLCGKDKPVWIDALERLKTIPLKETLEKLELSYIGLEDDYKEIFLDVACFLKGSLKDKTIRVLESCGFHAKNGLRVLEQKSLIRITKNDVFNSEMIQMHDHLEEMGKNIVRRFHTDDPHRHTRLWIQEEIEDILANDLGTEATRCVSMRLSPQIALKGLGKLSKLRVLFLNHQRGHYYPDLDVKIDEVSHFPLALRYLHWEDYPHWCLPKTFRLNNLVALVLEGRKLKQLWEGGEREVLNKLRYLELRYSKLRTLDLGLTPNLQYLFLVGCLDLVEFDVHGGCLKTLVHLNLFHCLSLKYFSFIKHMESLEVLNLSRLNLRKFPDIIPAGHCKSSLLKLNFSSNDIKKLPSSLGNLHKLVDLDISGCRKLKKLPNSICRLRHLRTLSLECCVNIKELPEDLGHLESLEKLDLTWTRISYIPSSICNLKHLRNLKLKCCLGLKALPEKFGDLKSLQVLNVKRTPLIYLPRGITLLKGLEIIGHRVSIEQILEDSIMYPDAVYPSMFQSSF